ncbi:nuclear transport factor 2 family protein [Pleurocapsa sp. CCALA 161]|uniref:nuclear transport factor 2 family protein n=1 Tax=Pleurocapsa sp. CCALA 161 TaxID=2107688 RepID=UPI002100A7EA|nr:nuclear transport factor 2 family protein [Pleurocapsa sp. CCALA 161]
MDFLTSLEDKDMDKFASVWAEDAVQDMPFSPEGFPKRVEGKANLIKHYAAWPETSGKANFIDELVFYPMQDATMVFAEWRGNVEIITTGRNYNQRYGGLFHVVDGKIELFREYYDPIVFKDAFGLD